MEKRTLGNSRIVVSPLCFGGNIFGWTVDEAMSFQLLDAFVDAGLEFIDTADVYSRWISGHQGGESETILGNWMKQRGNRASVILATKVGMEMGTEQKGLAKSYILRAAEDSLRRLQTDYIDLYQSHRDDSETPLEETLAAYDQLIRQGKVRAIGASNYTGERLAEARKVSQENGLPTYECLQPHYNLYDRADYEQNIALVVKEQGIGVIPYFSLASGFLTGKYRSEEDFSKSARGQGMKKYLNTRGFRILDALDQIAQQYTSTPARVALAWLSAQPGITAPIASATSLSQLNDLVESMRLQLDTAALEALNQASA